jgi:hypothetical protein
MARDLSEVTCGCGRVWLLARQNLIEWESYSIVCMCGRTVKKWRGRHFWMAQLSRDREFPR